MTGVTGGSFVLDRIGVADNGVVAIAKASETHPDLVLLDIVMPEVDGFDVARHLSDPRPLIVFQTAHDEHALRAFEHEAVDYVVKPITRERSRLAVSEGLRSSAIRIVFGGISGIAAP